MKREKRLIYLIIYYLLYYGVVQQFFWNSQFLDIIPDILVLYLTYYAWPKTAKVHYRKIISSSAMFVFCAFLTVGVVSAMIEYSSFLSCLWGTRIYVRYAFLFFSMYNCLEYKDVVRIKKIFIKALNINLLFCVFEFFVLGVSGDPYSGTIFGGNGCLVFFLTPALYFFLSDYFIAHRKIDWSYLSLYFCGLLFVAIVGEIKMMYFFIPLLVYFVFTITRSFNMRNLFFLVFVFVALLPIYRYAMSFNYDENYINNTFDAKSIQSEIKGKGFGTFNRNTVLENSAIYLADTSTHLYIGRGFGTSSSSKLFPTEFINKNKGLGFQFFTFSYVVAESGYVGIILVVLFHIILFYRFGRYYFKYHRDCVMKYWAGIGIISIPLQFLLAWYNNLPVYNAYFSVILWSLVVIAIKCRLQELNRI